jgi:intracellular sulfur oxidation DsrE/DsrF family protein
MSHLTRLLAAFTLAVVALGATLGGAAASSDRYGTQKAVYHINVNGGEGDAYYLGALRNIQNHLNAVGAENMDMRVVLHGNGLNLLANALTNETLQTRVVELKGQNVSFAICNNTIVGRNINPDTDLFDVWEDDIVPSGVAELSYLQQQGFTYVKP